MRLLCLNAPVNILWEYCSPRKRKEVILRNIRNDKKWCGGSLTILIRVATSAIRPYQSRTGRGIYSSGTSAASSSSHHTVAPEAMVLRGRPVSTGRIYGNRRPDRGRCRVWIFLPSFHIRAYHEYLCMDIPIRAGERNIGIGAGRSNTLVGLSE